MPKIPSMHHTSKVDEYTGKPEIIQFYNSTKSGVESLDQECTNYTTSHGTRRWSMAVFFALLDVAGVNISVLVNENSNQEKSISRREILMSFSMALVQSFCTIRSSNKVLPRERCRLTCQVAEIPFAENQYTEEQHSAAKRARCDIRPREKDRKSTLRYAICKNSVCKEHALTVCSSCIKNFSLVSMVVMSIYLKIKVHVSI